MENFDKMLWRGPHPDYQSLAEDDFDAVINLEPGYRDIWQEMYDAGMFNIGVHPMPLCPVFAPSKAAVIYIVDCLRGLSNINVKVLVHCLKGVDRTGYVVAAYRVLVQGWTIDAACAEWKEKGRSWWLGWWEFTFRRDISAVLKELETE